MAWSIAEAKQQFSEVMRQARNAPRLIHNRGTLVAAVVNPDILGEIESWKKRADQTTLASEMAELRQFMQAESVEGLTIPPRSNRANPSADALKKSHTFGRIHHGLCAARKVVSCIAGAGKRLAECPRP